MLIYLHNSPTFLSSPSPPLSF